MMYEISEENRNVLVQYLDNSMLPHADVKQLVQLLLSLKKVEPEKPKGKKDVDK
jgi:hypothetical protein